MQYILVFGAVFLIMLAVILLFFFLINTTAEDVSGQVRKTFLKEMEVFDELYEEKAKKLKKVQDEYDKFNRNILRKTDDEPKQEAAAPSVKAAASMSDIPFSPEISKRYAEASNRKERGMYITDGVRYNADAVGAFNILRKYLSVSGKQKELSVTGLKNPEIIKVAV